jgi:hypothetical protein
MNHDYRYLDAEQELSWGRNRAIAAVLIVALFTAGLQLVIPHASAEQAAWPVPCDELLLARGTHCICY